jgi:putative oxygen-independent coproporphyrinogen III oxidase
MSLAIYIHWPFCQSKCPYCDFNSHVAATIDHAAWRDAYKAELEYYAAFFKDRTVTSIFFGGGTPSLMEADTLGLILETIRKHWKLSDTIEITCEANPTSVEAQKFIDFQAVGINRLSLGVQSFDNEALKFLGRAHDAGQARRAIELAAQHFPRFSFDLIYARKDQTLASWKKELSEALTLAQGHLSLYQLTIEPNTQFYTLSNRGEILTAPDEEAARMFEATQDILMKAGLPAYEISNHAVPGAESHHNLTYWHYKDYIGVGPGAHGRYQFQGQRFATEDHRSPDVWLRHVREQGHGVRVADDINPVTSMREALMMGLRLTKGIDFRDWDEKFSDPLTRFLPSQKMERLKSEGYLETSEHALMATHAGRQRLNAVLNYLLN